MDPESISDYVLRYVDSGEDITFKELWREQSCVIIFLRRYIIKVFGNIHPRPWLNT